MQTERPVVLAVEDDEAMSALLTDLLEQEGYAVEVAAGGTSGLVRIEAGGSTSSCWTCCCPTWTA